jgi:hypothetical protein
MSNENLITPELYDAHPEYAEAGLKVGDPVPETELVDFTVTQEFLDAHPEAPEGVKVGDVIQIPSVVMPAKVTPPPVVPVEPVVPVREPVKTFTGQTVISDGFREVNGKEFRHIKIADGSTYDLTEKEYQERVIIS